MEYRNWFYVHKSVGWTSDHLNAKLSTSDRFIDRAVIAGELRGKKSIPQKPYRRLSMALND